MAESPRTLWHCRLALAALSARSWLWTWKLYVREKEVRGGEKARQALTLSMPPPAKLSGPSWGYMHRELSALVCSCILSQTCSQLIWDVISFFLKPQQTEIHYLSPAGTAGWWAPAPSLALGAVPGPLCDASWRH